MDRGLESVRIIGIYGRESYCSGKVSMRANSTGRAQRMKVISRVSYWAILGELSLINKNEKKNEYSSMITRSNDQWKRVEVGSVELAYWVNL